MKAATTPDTTHRVALNDRVVHDLLDEWLAATLITSGQMHAIEAYHHTHHAEDQRSLGYRQMVTVASLLGAILVSAGVLLVVGSNWSSFTASTKAFLAIATFVVIEAIGYFLRFRTVYPRTGEAILFVGASAYGGAVFLVAQAYNRPVDDPSLFLMWLVPILPLAYIVRSRLIAALAILVTYGTIAYRLADWIEGTGDGEILAVTGTYLLVGAALAGIGGVHRDVDRARYLAPPWEWLGVAAVAVMLFIAGFRNIYEGSGLDWLDEVAGGLVALLIVSLMALIGSVIARIVLRGTFDAEARVTSAIGGAAFLAFGTGVMASSMSDVVAFMLANAVMLGFVAALVVGGISTGRQAFVNLGLVVFAVTVFARYLEIGAGMLGTGTAMILGGLLLIGLGVGLERFRRSLIARIDSTGGAP